MNMVLILSILRFFSPFLLQIRICINVEHRIGNIINSYQTDNNFSPPKSTESATELKNESTSDIIRNLPNSFAQ